MRIRSQLKKGAITSPSTSIYQQRGEGSSRLEQLSDGVFALAITLLLISSKIPETSEELISFTGDILAFAASTIVLIAIWYQHYLYFLRFNLKDKRTVVLNTFLLLVVLFYVYPLKFVISFILRYLGYGLLILLGIDFDREAYYALVTSVSSWETLPTIMIIYSAGYFSLMLAFALLYRHANRQKEVLSLTDWERWKSSKTMFQYFIQAGVAIVSILISLVAEWTNAPWYAVAGGFAYFLIGVAIYILDRVFEKKKPSEVAKVPVAISIDSAATDTSLDPDS
ncbi:TMEM175 family protein [Tunicatimonas pelagia]|uniref:TMEM175 family protein n=1 Tax=Tunicatimonas pelagia TaxID=931531 RepID=UPI0026659021|nr:TMEM175 family protein [Tunicatimonas pelagia]WKN45945.1 TMEM175 family protein [Tunicatimonas pelagia]